MHTTISVHYSRVAASAGFQSAEPETWSVGAERGLGASREDHVVGKDSVAKPLETKELSSPRNNFSAGLATLGLASTYILIFFFF